MDRRPRLACICGRHERGFRMTQKAMSPACTESEVLEMMESLSNWGRWGRDDVMGTLNFITPEVRAHSATLVSEGRAVSCGRLIEFAPKAPANEAPIPPIHFMQATGESSGTGSGEAYDWIGLPLHGLYLTHLDSHAHVFWNGWMYNGQPASAVTGKRGAALGSVELAASAIVGRGVLIDAAGDGDVVNAVRRPLIESVVRDTNTEMRSGDILLVRTGYGKARGPKGEGWGGEGQAVSPGLAPDCLPWLHEHEISVLATDAATDSLPSPYPKLHSPVHHVAITAMGMWIVDNCDFEALAATCRELGRWEFFITMAPLRLKNSTGSPLNPIAVF